MGLIEEYFIDPILNNEGYNPVNTLTYGIILIGAVLGIYRLLLRFRIIPGKISVDKDFVKAVFPFVVFGGVIRAVNDHYIRSYLLVTPFIYIVIFLLAILSLSMGVWLTKYKIEYWKLPFAVGALLWLYAVFNIKSITPWPIALTMLIAFVWYLLFELARSKNILGKVFTKENNYVLFCQFVDAGATFIALGFFGDLFWEQHFLPRFFISTFGAWSFFLLKLLVVPLVLWSLDDVKDPELRKLLKVVIAILGLAPGIRDAFTVGIRISL